ncbi:hypothetical protein HDC94_000500 [Leifsonia sp. AK011]|nr:hypothetical protein [Leifsonia sp. AK011]NYF09344.1 hypothetical protein [Leifsonia sp. AK011]
MDDKPRPADNQTDGTSDEATEEWTPPIVVDSDEPATDDEYTADSGGSPE